MSTKPLVPSRRLGKDGPMVPAVGFGLMVMSGVYGVLPNEEERFQLLNRAVELGDTFWDTSDIYGDNEELIGRWLKRTGKRDHVFLASKFGIMMEKLQHKGINSSAEYCKKCCDASLKKLGTDTIDLYYAHRLNPDTPIEETMRAMVELKEQGKIKHIGLSEVSSNTLRRAYKIAPVAAVQMEYSPFVLDIEQDIGTNLLATARELGVAVVCYSPLGRGLLTGMLTSNESVSGPNDYRAHFLPWFNAENLESNAEVVSKFKNLADKKSCSTSQLALAWILKQGDDFIPIPGTKKLKYLEENVRSVEIHLTDEEEAEIRKFAESAKLSGARTTPSGLASAYVETKEEN